MTKTPLTLAAATLLGGLILGSGSASAAPLPMSGLQAGQPVITQVAMTRSERMMMKRRMMNRM